MGTYKEQLVERAGQNFTVLLSMLFAEMILFDATECGKLLGARRNVMRVVLRSIGEKLEVGVGGKKLLTVVDLGFIAGSRTSSIWDAFFWLAVRLTAEREL